MEMDVSNVGVLWGGNGEHRKRAIVTMFGVDQAVISRITHSKTWTHI